MIKQLDLGRQYEQIKTEILAKFAEIAESQYFILGPEVSKFEDEMASYIGVKHAIGCSSGTDALIMALMALEIGPGHEVITTPFTFFATAGAISRVGATPVFVDIEPNFYNLDPQKIEAAITPKTRAIIPVHLYGQCANWAAIKTIAETHRLAVIEDACQAIGAKWQGQQAGTLGNIGTFSFFPSKNLGGFGDAGLVTTNDDALAKTLHKIRVHGSERRYYHDIMGGNFRIDALQAAFLRIKLRYLESWHEGRNKVAAAYTEFFETKLNEVVKTPKIAPFNDRHVFHQYVIEVPRRDDLRQYLADRQISSEIYYPVPLHLQNCYEGLGYKVGDLPVSENAANSILALPIYPELTHVEIDEITTAILSFYQS